MIPLDSLIQPIWSISPDPIAIMNFDRDPQMRKFLFVNSAFTQATGFSAAEAIGRLSSFLYGPETNPAAVQEFETAIIQGTPCRTVLTHYRKDGSHYDANLMIAPLLDPDGGARYLILIETKDPAPASAPKSLTAPNYSVVVPLYLPMPLKEFPSGVLPKHLTSHPKLDLVEALWTKLRGDRVLPRREDFDLRTMIPWATHLSVATAMPMGRFQFRLFGSDLAFVYGQDLTGRFLDELSPKDLWAVVTLHYQEVVRTLRPLFAPISIANGRWYSEVSRLLLPIAAEHEANTVGFIMGIDYPRVTH